MTRAPVMAMALPLLLVRARAKMASHLPMDEEDSGEGQGEINRRKGSQCLYSKEFKKGTRARGSGLGDGPRRRSICI